MEHGTAATASSGTSSSVKHSSNNNTTTTNADDSFSGDGMSTPADDTSWWNCSLCTYKNSADKFKCEICDLRRGTSTRKPRCSADTIVAQVVKQQEQIRQQTRVTKTPAKSRLTSSHNNPATSSNNDSTTSTSKTASKSSKTSAPESSKNRRSKNDARTADTDDNSDTESEVSSPKTKKKRPNVGDSSTKSATVKNQHSKNKPGPNRISHAQDHDEDDDDNEPNRHNSTDESSGTDVSNYSTNSSPRIRKSASNSSLDSSDYSSSSDSSPEPTTTSLPPSTKRAESPLKITTLEVNGNLIKYSPPTSTGRTGLIIDKKRFTQHSVTVNDVTITFTEFATRQNKYVRKKKKRHESNKSKSNNSNETSSNSNVKDSKSSFNASCNENPST